MFQIVFLEEIQKIRSGVMFHLGILQLIIF